MSGRKRLNKNHPDLPEYKRKFDQLVQEMNAEADRVHDENPDFQGRDGPVAAVHKKYHLKISALQKEYSHLYIEVSDDGD